MEMPKKVAPSGLPSCMFGCSGDACFCPSGLMDVLSRNSCVTAMPIEAKAREVRSQARKVRSVSRGRGSAGGGGLMGNGRWEMEWVCFGDGT